MSKPKRKTKNASAKKTPATSSRHKVSIGGGILPAAPATAEPVPQLQRRAVLGQAGTSRESLVD